MARSNTRPAHVQTVIDTLKETNLDPDFINKNLRSYGIKWYWRKTQSKISAIRMINKIKKIASNVCDDIHYFEILTTEPPNGYHGSIILRLYNN